MKTTSINMSSNYVISLNKTSLTFKISLAIILLLFWTVMGAYYTSLNSMILQMRGINTNWFHLSFNYFSRTWIWFLLTPPLFLLYNHIFLSNSKNSKKIIYTLILGLLVTCVHVFSSLYLDVSLRKWLNVIDIDFWNSISSELPLIIKYLSSSMGTYILLITIFICNDHFNFINVYENVKADMPVPDYKDTSISTKKNNNIHNKISKKLTVKSEGRIMFLDPSQIRCLESKGNYVRIRLEAENIVVRATLNSMHNQLPEHLFFRINRSIILNEDFIKELKPWLNGEYTIRMIDGKDYRTGRAFRSQLNLLLNKTNGK